MTRLESPFVPWCDLTADPLAPTAAGPLDGVRLAVKDVFDVGGFPTGGGNPAWLAEHPSASRDAEAVSVLRRNGATVVGKTHTDELAYSLAGSNAHYGDLENPRVADATPGGSSSGSAVAVATGLADLALGTDTAGSVRVPAAWCGLYGLRPTWGRVSTRGVMALGPSHDTVGLLSADPGLLETAALLLLDPAPAPETTRFLVPDDVWALASPEVLAALTPVLGRLTDLLPVERVEALLHRPPETLLSTFGTTQGAQVWRTFGAWIRHADPPLGDDVRQRMSAAAALTPSDVALAQRHAGAVRTELHETLRGRVMVMPTVPVTAPTPEKARTPGLRSRLLALTVAASIAGLPALTVPFETADGLPVGLCLVGAPDSDEALFPLARALSR